MEETSPKTHSLESVMFAGHQVGFMIKDVTWQKHASKHDYWLVVSGRLRPCVSRLLFSGDLEGIWECRLVVGEIEVFTMFQALWDNHQKLNISRNVDGLQHFKAGSYRLSNMDVLHTCSTQQHRSSIQSVSDQMENISPSLPELW